MFKKELVLFLCTFVGTAFLNFSSQAEKSLTCESLKTTKFHVNLVVSSKEKVATLRPTSAYNKSVNSNTTLQECAKQVCKDSLAIYARLNIYEDGKYKESERMACFDNLNKLGLDTGEFKKI